MKPVWSPLIKVVMYGCRRIVSTAPFCDSLHGTVLERDGTKGLRFTSHFFLRQENNEGAIDPFQISGSVMEIIEKSTDVRFGNVPS